jgi:hypothetical protein
MNKFDLQKIIKETETYSSSTNNLMSQIVALAQQNLKQQRIIENLRKNIKKINRKSSP